MAINSRSVLPTLRDLALAVRKECQATPLQQSGMPFHVLLISFESVVTKLHSRPEPLPRSSPLSVLFRLTAISFHLRDRVFSLSRITTERSGSGDLSISGADGDSRSVFRASGRFCGSCECRKSAVATRLGAVLAPSGVGADELIYE